MRFLKMQNWFNSLVNGFANWYDYTIKGIDASEIKKAVKTIIKKSINVNKFYQFLALLEASFIKIKATSLFRPKRK